MWHLVNLNYIWFLFQRAPAGHQRSCSHRIFDATSGVCVDVNTAEEEGNVWAGLMGNLFCRKVQRTVELWSIRRSDLDATQWLAGNTFRPFFKKMGIDDFRRLRSLWSRWNGNINGINSFFQFQLSRPSCFLRVRQFGTITTSFNNKSNCTSKLSSVIGHIYEN